MRNYLAIFVKILNINKQIACKFLFNKIPWPFLEALARILTSLKLRSSTKKYPRCYDFTVHAAGGVLYNYNYKKCKSYLGVI